MIARLAQRTRGIPVVAASAATVAALHETGARRIALLSPPWFDAHLDQLGRRYHHAAGFDVMRSSPCDLPSDQARITTSDLYDHVCTHTPADADAVVIGGNGFRAVGAIAAFEQTLERPVVTANQALLWAGLNAAGADPSAVAGYGRIFRVTGDSQHANLGVPESRR